MKEEMEKCEEKKEGKNDKELFQMKNECDTDTNHAQ